MCPIGDWLVTILARTATVSKAPSLVSLAVGLTAQALWIISRGTSHPVSS
jgi:hypothetical protein